MAKKKASSLFTCLHCSKEFILLVKWCGQCQDHLSDMGWRLGKDTCDRCYNGLNDAYLKRKKGSAARQEKFLKEVQEKHGPFVLALRDPSSCVQPDSTFSTKNINDPF